MPRTVQYHKIPQTSRISLTLTTPEIKELRKLSIDLEVPEKEVFRFALLNLIKRYQKGDIEAILADFRSIMGK